MASSAQPRLLRALSGIERFSAAGYHLGLYRCVAVSARYEGPAGLSAADVEALLTTAVASVVKDQPILRAGIFQPEDGNASYTHLTTVDLRYHIHWRPVSVFNVPSKEYDDELNAAHIWLHNQSWPDIINHSPWTIMVLQPRHESPSEPTCFDVLFSFHHAIADGVSGKEFLQHLMSALRSSPPITSPPPTELSFPDPPELPDPQDTMVPFKNSYFYIAKTLWDAMVPEFLKPRPPNPPHWSAKLVDFSRPNKTRLRPIHLSQPILSSLLAGSRENKSSITSTITALVLVSLARRLTPEEATSFITLVPINLRPWFSPPPTRSLIRNAYTSISSHHTAPIVDALRDPSATDDHIWKEAHRVRDEITNRTSTLPANESASLINLISDMLSYYRDKDGKSRSSSWEVSNAGVLPSGNDSKGGWSITRGMFTSGAIVAGPPLCFNTMSLEGGALTIGLTWQEGVVDENLAEGIAADITSMATRYHEQGRFL